MREKNYGQFQICAIGISTGGPQTLTKLLSSIPATIDGSILITQHMPAEFTKSLAINLDRTSKINVIEGSDGMIIEKGTAYIAPGSHHMKIEGKHPQLRIKLDDSPPNNFCKPSVNVMYDSLVSHIPEKTVGILMTGMGNDGYEGMKKLKTKNAYLIGQNEQSCLVYGMPSQVTSENIVNESLNVTEIADRIINLLGEN